MLWEAVKADHIGGRDEQQDRVIVLAARDGSERLLVLADGMGGHKGGALAAQAVIDAARHEWHKHLVTKLAPAELLKRICLRAHDRVNEAGAETGLDPHSTCVLFHSGTEDAHWAHVGDSRLYVFRDGTLRERSRDHSVVQMLVDMGKIEDSEMADHPDQNRLTQSLGGTQAPAPDFGKARIESGDGFLLCSDGLWESIEVDEMAEALAAPSLGRAAKELVGRAARIGGAEGDNISVALARPGAVGARRGRRRWVLLLAVLGLAAVAGWAARTGRLDGLMAPPAGTTTRIEIAPGTAGDKPAPTPAPKSQAPKGGAPEGGSEEGGTLEKLPLPEKKPTPRTPKSE